MRKNIKTGTRKNIYCFIQYLKKFINLFMYPANTEVRKMCSNGNHVGRRVVVLRFGGGYLCHECGRDIPLKLITCSCGRQEYRADPIPHKHV